MTFCKQLPIDFLPRTIEFCYYKYPEKLPKIIATFFSPRGALYINDPEIVYELYVSKNRYFDKHPGLKNLTYELMGDSILLSESN